MKYFVKMYMNIVGCEGTDVFEAKDQAEAEKFGWEMAVGNAESFVEVVNPDDFSEEEWDEFEQSHEGSYLGGFVTLADIDFYAEPYDAKKHSGYL